MKNKTTEHLDKLSRKVMNEKPVEKLSSDFTANLILQIEAQKTSSTLTYKPLISKKGWIMIAAMVALGLSYILFKGITFNKDWSQSVNFDGFSNSDLSETFSNLSISPTWAYGIVLFTLMLAIQILFLKRYFNRRFEV